MAINFEQSLLLLDNVKLNVGTGSDLQIYHDSSNSYIKDTGTGDLRIWGDNVNIGTASGNKVFFNNSGVAELYYTGGTKKLETTNTGVSVTGGVTTSSSSDMAGINMTSDLALGSNDLTDSNSQSGAAGQLLSSLGSGNGTDWVNAPVDGVTSVATSAPITGGTITGTGTIGITQADATTNGYLSSTDWSTFNSKGSGTVTGTGVNNRLAIWNGTTAIDSDSAFYTSGTGLYTTDLIASGAITATGEVAGGSLDISGIANISDTLTLVGTTDQILILKSTDDGAIYQAYYRGTDRHAYLGFGGSSDRFDIVNEESGGSIALGTNSITALTLDSSQNATFAGTINSGAITSTGQITGTELEGTSLDINGGANISGTIITGGGHYISSSTTTGFYTPNTDLYITAANNASATGGIIFKTNNGGTSTERLSISSAGDAIFTGRVTINNDLRILGDGSSPSQGTVRLLTDSSDKLTIDAGNDGAELFTFSSVGKFTATNINLTDAGGGNMIVLNSSTGDASIRWQDNSVQKWDMGRDNTDNSWALSNTAGLGSSNVLKFDHSTGNATFSGTLSATVNADDATYTGIVTVDGGTLKYRTKAEILSDIGAGTGSGTVTGTGSSGRIAFWDGTSSITSDSGFTFSSADDSITLGKVKVGNGTEALPSLTFNADTDTGFYSPGTAQVSLSISGTEVFGFGSAGIGVFINSPLVPTATLSDSSTKAASTAFVKGQGYTTNTGTVTSVTGSSPISSTGGTTPEISIATAGASATGALTSTDWNTFNNKTSNTGTVTSIGITETGTALTITNTPITGSGNINIAGAGTSSQVILGDLSLATLPETGVTSIATTSPITGGTITGTGTIAFDSTAVTSLANLNTTGTVVDGVWNSNTQLTKTSSTAMDYQGEVVYLASSTVVKGKVYVYSGGDWVAADADAVSTASGTLAVALNNGTSSTVGMLTRGMFTGQDLGDDGDLVYLDTSAGSLTIEPPSGSGDIVRIVGQLIDSTNGQTFFNPDYTFITIS